MKPKLFISRISNLHDARYCAAMGMNFIGFDRRKNQADKIETERVAEIAAWISGPELIAEFDYESPLEINDELSLIQFRFVSLPGDYPQNKAYEIAGNLIFRLRTPEDHSFGFFPLMEKLAKNFPDALFEILLSETQTDSIRNSDLDQVFEKIIICPSDPEKAWEILKHEGKTPFGFSLGGFFAGESEFLNYDLCDDFIDKFNEVLTA